MMQIETKPQYRKAWEKRIQLEKRIQEQNRHSDAVYLRVLKCKMRKYANKEVTKEQISLFIWIHNLKKS